MKVGAFVSIPPRTKHKFTNRSDRPAVTFDVYSRRAGSAFSGIRDAFR
jgi:oxalate decarboxylase/phosphoglucose isomerase-like protein (cupin superfamily)